MASRKAREADTGAAARALIAKGDKYFAEAVEHESTGWFKWAPDWVLSAMAFEQAASAYKQAKHYKKAKAAYLRQARAREETKLMFSAAQCLEKAAQMELEEAPNGVAAANMYERAATFYEEDGKLEKAAGALTKGAKAVADDYEKASAMMARAMQYFEGNDSILRYGQDTFKYAITLQVQHKKYVDAARVVREVAQLYFMMNQKNNVHKSIVSIIVLHLAADDFVGADEAYNNYISSTCEEAMSFIMTDDSKVCMRLLSVFEKGDMDGLREVVQTQIFDFIHPSVGRVARQLPDEAKADNLESFGLGGFAPSHTNVDFDIAPFPTDILEGGSIPPSSSSTTSAPASGKSDRPLTKEEKHMADRRALFSLGGPSSSSTAASPSPTKPHSRTETKHDDLSILLGKDLGEMESTPPRGEPVPAVSPAPISTKVDFGNFDFMHSDNDDEAPLLDNDDESLVGKNAAVEANNDGRLKKLENDSELLGNDGGLSEGGDEPQGKDDELLGGEDGMELVQAGSSSPVLQDTPAREEALKVEPAVGEDDYSDIL